MNLFGLLGLLLIGLKLAEVGVVATWSWWLVLLPIYGGLGLMFAVMLFGLILTIFTGRSSYNFKRR